MKSASPVLLSTTQVAKMCGIDRKTAYRWMRAVERKQRRSAGHSVVVRCGRRLCTTMAGLQRLLPPMGATEDEQETVDRDERIAMLEKEIVRLERSFRIEIERLAAKFSDPLRGR